MKKLLFTTGGRPYANDDFEVLQQETYAAIAAVLIGAPPMVLGGCRFENLANNRGNIGPGIVWLGGEIQHFDGVSNVQFPAEIVLDVVEESDPRPYQIGGTQNCMAEQLLKVQAFGISTAANAVQFGIKGPDLTYWKWVENKTRYAGEVQWVTRYNPEHYDGTGKGWHDQEARGWAICNGNNGTSDLRERFIVAMNPANSAYAVGAKGGEAQVTLTTQQMPEHKHEMQTGGKHSHSVDTAQIVRSGDDGTRRNTLDPGNPGGPQRYTTSTHEGHTHTIDNAGGNQPHENRPPYFSLMAREWIGL